MFGNCFYRDYEFKADDNILAFDSDEMNKKVKLFITTSINKITNGSYSYGRQYRIKSFEQTSIMLPIKETGEPDWTYMEKYIKAIEKVVIKDVVKYKDEMIAKTKEVVVSNSNI